MQKNFINTTIILVLLLGGATFFLWPKYKDFNGLRMNVQEKKTEMANKETYFSKLNEASLKLKNYGSELQKINAALPATATVPELVDFLAKKSSENGLILERVTLDKISPLEKDSQTQKISLNISLSGFYPSLKNFLSSLQKNSRLIEVDSILFSEPDLGNTFTIDLKIKAYSY